MKIRCKRCSDILEDDKRSPLIGCSCKTIAIDETKWYCRILYKKREDYEEVK